MKKDFKKGDRIIYCDEEFEVIDNYGNSGTVKDMGGDIINNFDWFAYGEECVLKTV